MPAMKRGAGNTFSRAVTDAVSILAYQKNSIVSCEIIRKNAGTVTVFAFDKGEGLSEHIAAFDALVFILEGEAKISVSGKPFILHKGQMIIMPAHKPHALKALRKFKMLLIMIKS
jgi:quercetin dioxygenase-like cupin family protein